MENVTCNCRECQQPMDAVWQPGLIPGREGMWLVTCENPKCGMRMYTFSLRNYPTVDLGQYRKVETVG